MNKINEKQKGEAEQVIGERKQKKPKGGISWLNIMN